MPYRTIPHLVEAFRWQGQPRSEWPVWATESLLAESGSALYAYTKDGPMRVSRGDWCVLGVDSPEILPYTDAEFRKRYEPWMPRITQTMSIDSVGEAAVAGHDIPGEDS